MEVTRLTALALRIDLSARVSNTLTALIIGVVLELPTSAMGGMIVVTGAMKSTALAL